MEQTNTNKRRISGKLATALIVMGILVILTVLIGIKKDDFTHNYLKVLPMDSPERVIINNVGDERGAFLAEYKAGKKYTGIKIEAHALRFGKETDFGGAGEFFFNSSDDRKGTLAIIPDFETGIIKVINAHKEGSSAIEHDIKDYMDDLDMDLPSGWGPTMEGSIGILDGGMYVYAICFDQDGHVVVPGYDVKKYDDNELSQMYDDIDFAVIFEVEFKQN